MLGERLTLRNTSIICNKTSTVTGATFVERVQIVISSGFQKISTTKSVEHRKTSKMPQVKAMYHCICWNIGTTSQDIRDWTLGDTVCPAVTKYLLKMSHISLLLEKVTKSWEISVGRDEGLDCFAELPWFTTAVKGRWDVVRWFSGLYCN